MLGTRPSAQTISSDGVVDTLVSSFTYVDLTICIKMQKLFKKNYQYLILNNKPRYFLDEFCFVKVNILIVK